MQQSTRRTFFSLLRRNERGFTLIEMAVSLVVMLEVLLTAFLVFESNRRLSHVQTAVAEMQQSLRIAQHDMVRLVRMAGRGGLPLQDPNLTDAAPQSPIPFGLALLATNDVGSNEHIVNANTTSPRILEGTDVLTVRGSLNNPVYIVDRDNANSGTNRGFTLKSDGLSGTIEICYQVAAGLDQDLSGLVDLIDSTQPGFTFRAESLILVSSFDDRAYAVVELVDGSLLTATNTCPTIDADNDGIPAESGVTLNFVAHGGRNTDAYNKLSPGDDDVAAVQARLAQFLAEGLSYVAVLEEYRYFVRDDAINPASTHEIQPILTRSRFYPNTDLPYPDETDFDSLRVDIAENVFDLQIAMGFDTDGDGDADEGPNATDEWIFNDPGDGPLTGALRGVRISTLARTDRPDNKYEAPIIERLEDRFYMTGATSALNSDEARKYRRRVLRSDVAIRNNFQIQPAVPGP